MQNQIVRQGDVLLIPIDAPTAVGCAVPRRNGLLILAEGEATGHHHAVECADAQLFETANKSDDLLLTIEADGAILRHQEHAPIRLSPGWMLVRRQREYVPAAPPKQVVD